MLLTVRKFVEGEESLIVNIARESWRWTYGGIYESEFISGWIERNYSPPSLRNDILRSELDDGLLFLGAFLGQTCVGFLEITLDSPQAELLRLYFLPDRTRKGYGAILLAESVRTLRSRKIHSIRVSVHKLNQIGLQFYLKNGFSINGEVGDELVMVMDAL